MKAAAPKPREVKREEREARGFTLSSLLSTLSSTTMYYRKTILWQKAMEAARETYRLTPRLPGTENYGMRSQITRAAVSMPANIAEGWTRETVKDKAHFLAIA